MRNKAIVSGVWSYVEPAYLTPTWVVVDLVSRSGMYECYLSWKMDNFFI